MTKQKKKNGLEIIKKKKKLLIQKDNNKKSQWNSDKQIFEIKLLIKNKKKKQYSINNKCI